MSEIVRKSVPDVKISGNEGRQGKEGSDNISIVKIIYIKRYLGISASFEIQMNDQLVYSKLQTMAFPDYEAVTDLAKEISQGQPIRPIKKEQPIDCAVS